MQNTNRSSKSLSHSLFIAFHTPFTISHRTYAAICHGIQLISKFINVQCLIKYSMCEHIQMIRCHWKRSFDRFHMENNPHKKFHSSIWEHQMKMFLFKNFTWIIYGLQMNWFSFNWKISAFCFVHALYLKNT